MDKHFPGIFRATPGRFRTGERGLTDIPSTFFIQVPAAHIPPRLSLTSRRTNPGKSNSKGNGRPNVTQLRAQVIFPAKAQSPPYRLRQRRHRSSASSKTSLKPLLPPWAPGPQIPAPAVPTPKPISHPLDQQQVVSASPALLTFSLCSDLRRHFPAEPKPFTAPPAFPAANAELLPAPPRSDT